MPMAALKCPSSNLILLLALSVFTVFGGASAELTAYEQLEAHGLPANLLPKTVASYKLWATGYFEVTLDGECYSSVEYGKIPVYYAPVLTGFLGKARLSFLRGISVKPPQYGFFWLRVVTIFIDASPDPNIHIGVGLGFQEAFNLSNFSTDSPVCGEPEDKKPLGRFTAAAARNWNGLRQAFLQGKDPGMKRPFMKPK